MKKPAPLLGKVIRETYGPVLFQAPLAKVLIHQQTSRETFDALWLRARYRLKGHGKSKNEFYCQTYQPGKSFRFRFVPVK